MIFLQTVAVAFSMFSALPVPQPNWNEQNMRYALCAFPLVGIPCGLMCWLWFLLSQAVFMPDLLRGAGICLIPIIITGGIHLDGYADTCDALASCASMDKKQEILKDPHCGAFAVIRLGVYFIASLALCTTLQLSVKVLLCLSVAFVLSRTLSGLALTVFPLAKNTGLAHLFVSASDKKRVRNLLLILALLLSAVLLFFARLMGLFVLTAAAIAFWRYHGVAQKQFGGTSGDLAGWFLQKSELWILAALVLCQWMEAVR